MFLWAAFEFDEDQRHAVDEAHQVAAPLVDFTGNPELRCQEEVVVLRVLPVDDPQRLHVFNPLRVPVGNLRRRPSAARTLPGWHTPPPASCGPGTVPPRPGPALSPLLPGSAAPAPPAGAAAAQPRLEVSRPRLGCAPKVSW